MIYLDVYNKLAGVQIAKGTTMPIWHRIRLTFRIANSSPTIQEEIYKYLETQEQPEYSLTLVFTDPKTKKKKETIVSCWDIQNKMGLQPLPALLYMDWLRREPEQAAAFVMRKDDLPRIPEEKFRAHVDPELLAKADRIRTESEQNDLLNIESGG